MRNVSPKIMKYLTTHPNDMMKFQMTGRVPNSVCPDSPLISILMTLSPRERLDIKGLNICNLGYQNNQVWQNAEQLMRWLKPSSEVIGNYIAGSYQNRRFQKQLSLQDIKDNAHSFPEYLNKRLSSK